MLKWQNMDNQSIDHIIFFSESDRLTFAKASQLPAMIDSECHELKQMKVKLNKEKHRKDKQFWLYYQVFLKK